MGQRPRPVALPPSTRSGVLRIRSTSPPSRQGTIGAILVALATLLNACSPATPPSPRATTAAILTPSTTPGASASATPAPTPTPAPARWTDCGRGFECATISVPRDYSKPGPNEVNLALIRLRALDPARRIGALLVNPGGPGGSGIDFVRDNIDVFPTSLRKRFDIVGFDPRGVNESTPVRCLDTLDHLVAADPSPDSAAEREDLVEVAREFAEGCARRDGDLLPYITTDNVARDLDQIRASLGEDKLTYLGFSYGTFIGATYARLFPDRIRAMALDGAVDPSLGLTDFREQQAQAFELELRHFLADCASRTTCPFHSGGNPTAAFDLLMRRIDAHSLPAAYFGDGRRVGPGLAWSAVLGSMYSKKFWPSLALALALGARGDGSFFLALADPYRGRRKDGSYSNLFDAYTATNCMDFQAPTKITDYQKLATKFQAVAPHFGAILAYNDLSCAFWPVPASRTPGPLSVTGLPPIVVVGSTGDPATPYAWAKALAKDLSGVLITRQGDGHTGYLFSTCVSKAVNAYLTSLTKPKAGLVCH